MNLHGPDEPVFLPRGFFWSATKAGIKASGRSDVALAEIPMGASAAAMFTRNRVAAAPVEVGRSTPAQEQGTRARRAGQCGQRQLRHRRAGNRGGRAELRRAGRRAGSRAAVHHSLFDRHYRRAAAGGEAGRRRACGGCRAGRYRGSAEVLCLGHHDHRHAHEAGFHGVFRAAKKRSGLPACARARG